MLFLGGVCLGKTVIEDIAEEASSEVSFKKKEKSLLGEEVFELVEE